LFEIKVVFLQQTKNIRTMALEIKPVPVLRGKAARDFWKKIENFKTTETREEIQEVNRAVRESIEKSKRLGYI
jgi:hypothetical protein